jgi:rhodanese-related sulfurtransferase
MRRMMVFLVSTLLVTGIGLGIALAKKNPYNYMQPSLVKQLVEAQKPITLLDIQQEDGYNEHHIPGVLATYAYPVKTDADKAKLDKYREQLQAGQEPIVIICPRGAGGAQRTYDYLVEIGVSANRLFILEKGQGGWPYPELTEKTPKK